MNKDLRTLYDAFAHVYEKIGMICAGCKDHDCEGYVWLLAEEADALYNQGVPIVEINEGLHFLHSFEEVDGNVLVDKPKPPCRLRSGGLCTIYHTRPLVCRMYPIGFAMNRGSVQLVLHEDCQFSRELQGDARMSFFRFVVRVLQSVSPETIRRISDGYAEVDGISSFPDGQNSFEVIISIDTLLRKGGERHVEVQSGLGQQEGDQDHDQGEV